MKYENCRKCGVEFGGHALGLCKDCRKVKCAYPGCNKTISRNHFTAAVSTCQAHKNFAYRKLSYIDANLEGA